MGILLEIYFANFLYNVVVKLCYMKLSVKSIKVCIVSMFFIILLAFQMFNGIAATFDYTTAVTGSISPSVSSGEHENEELKQQINEENQFAPIDKKTSNFLQDYNTTNDPAISVVNPVTGRSVFMFDASVTSVGTRFNATIWVYNITDLFGYQVRLVVNDTLLNITRVWIPCWDSEWVFYNLEYIPLNPVLYDDDFDGICEATLFASSLLPPYTFNGSGLLAIVEFGIVYVPDTGQATTELDIDNSDTMLLDFDAMPITATKINGLYTIKRERQQLALYAGSSNPGIVYEYGGNNEWYAISQSLGTAVLCLVVWNGELYAGTTTGSNGIVYRYDGFQWSMIGEFPERQVSSLVVWNGELYAGTTYPANLYRYNPVNESWDLVLSDALPNGIRAMYVWERDNALYLGDYNSDTIGRYDGTNYTIVAEFGRSCIWDFQSYGEYLYASAWLGYLYRSFDGFNWEPALINPEERNIWALEEFQGYLYLGMDWTGSGAPEAQLWRYNGSTGELVLSIPVNSSHQGIISMATDGLYLYLGLGGEEGYYESYGAGKVYRYDGTNAELISGVMGEGVQCLLFAGPVQRPEHDLAIYLQVPDSLPVGCTTVINATVYNNGISNETSVEIYLQINDQTVLNMTLAYLNSSSTSTLSYPWTPNSTGLYNITAIVLPVNGENITENNRSTKEVLVSNLLITPEEGQYANYLFSAYNDSVTTPEWMKYNVTYAKYVSPSIINITTWQQSWDGYTYNSWMLVDVLTREIVGGGPYSSPVGYYYYGWIETNITIGDSIRIFDTYGYVKGEEVIAAAGTYIDCWVVETIVDYYNYTWWFDKATGLWIGVKMIDLSNPNMYILGLLVDTNIPVGGALIIETDKPMYARLETVTVTATYIIGNTPIENATITFQVDYPNGTLYFIWTEETNVNGTAVFRFFIDETAPYGVYTISATAYKIGYDPKSATTTFLVAYLEPRIVLWFEGPEVALVGFNTTIILHVENSGNATAYNVTAHLTIPDSLTVIMANTTFTGTIDPGKEITLIATVTTSLPSRHLLTASAEYFKADGTPMPIVYMERYIAFGYHQDYPVDIVAVQVSYTSTQIILNLTVTNYGESSVQVVLIASAQHIATKLVLKSAYRTVTLDPNETLSVQLVLNIPTSASTGDYLVKGILATDLPSNSGFTLTQVSRMITL